MIGVSTDFISAMTEPTKELRAYLSSEDGLIKSSDDLLGFKLSGEGGLGRTTMRRIDARFKGTHDLLGKEVIPAFGVILPDSSIEFVEYGSFLITEQTISLDTGDSTVVGYDLMIKTMVPYSPLPVEYPITLKVFAQMVCSQCGLELATDSFVHDDWSVDMELYENIDGITCRDILVEIAKASASICIIGTDDKVHIKYITETGDTLTYSNLLRLKLEQEYGEINSVVLSRTPQEDNIYMRDDASIEANGLTEFKIENNQIIDKDRDGAMQAIYDALHGISYYPFEADTEGHGWYEIGDRLTIQTDTGTNSVVVFDFSLTLDGGIKEKIRAEEPSKTLTQYQFATVINRRIKMAEIQVDKQGNTITSLVKDMYATDGLVNENFTQIFQDIDNIINAVQTSGGSNLLRNSVMFAFDNSGLPLEWGVSGSGTLEIKASNESISAGGFSGNVFVLNNKTVIQRVTVNIGSTYTFSCKVKKDAVGTGYIRIFNDQEEQRIDFLNGQAPFYADYEIRPLEPTMGYYDVEIYGSVLSNLTITDAMFSLGEFRTQWTQANGEIMNTQVNINVEGVLVRSSVYVGDYTVMSPLEFAGYSVVNGVLTKVFSLNKDTTEIKKLLVSNEMAMPPIKIVPITTGSVQGWAFVPMGA